MLPSLSPRAVWSLFAVLLLVGFGEGFYSYRLATTQRNIEAVVNRHGQTLEMLGQGLDAARESYADLQGELSFTKDRLGITQVELRRAQESSAHLARQQQ